MAVGQVVLRAFRFFSCQYHSTSLHTNPHLHAVLTRRTNDRSLITIQRATFCRKLCSSGQKSTCTWSLKVQYRAPNHQNRRCCFKTLYIIRIRHVPFEQTFISLIQSLDCTNLIILRLGFQVKLFGSTPSKTSSATLSSALLEDLNYIIYFTAITSALRFFP